VGGTVQKAIFSECPSSRLPATAGSPARYRASRGSVAGRIACAKFGLGSNEAHCS
jgi:hypothetical protein